ncbi:hypothetical protein HY638_06090 [Candidatus Woesearchaeota archaeon]|nr:hypothetical protein [Candidatus Woesearchaeota archaeon]
MQSNLKYGETLDERLEFVRARDEWVLFLREHLRGYGNPFQDLGVRVSEYLKEEGTETDVAKTMLEYLNIENGEMRVAVERKNSPWLGRRGDSLGMRFAYFQDSLHEAFRDAGVGIQHFAERKFDAKCGAKAGLVAGAAASAVYLGRLGYKAITDPGYRETVSQSPVEYALFEVSLLAGMNLFVAISGAMAGFLNQAVGRIKPNYSLSKNKNQAI